VFSHANQFPRFGVQRRRPADTAVAGHFRPRRHAWIRPTIGRIGWFQSNSEPPCWFRIWSWMKGTVGRTRACLPSPFRMEPGLARRLH